MDKVRAAIRPMDVVLAVALTALGALAMLGDINADDGTRIDSRSWLAIPVFLVATVVVLFRRSNMVAVVLVSIAAMAVHVAAFGWTVRCGSGLPLAFVLAYSAGRLVGDRVQSVITLVLTIGLQALVLVEDSAAGLGVLPVTALIGLAFWGIGLFVRHQTLKRGQAAAEPVPTPTHA